MPNVCETIIDNKQHDLFSNHCNATEGTMTHIILNQAVLVKLQ